MSLARLIRPQTHLRLRSQLRPFHSPRIRTMSSAIPKTMRGISIAKTGGVEVLEYRTDLPVPTPKEGEVLVKNEYIGINYIDTYFRTGLYPAPSFPYILGREAAGTVVSLGPASKSQPSDPSLTPGAHVVYLGQSSYAEYTATPALHVHALGSSSKVDAQTAAAALLQGLTAITLIREAYNVQKGDWVLVHAGAGGMGLWLCQLLRAAGAHTIATASTEQKRALAKENGAEEVLEYAEAMGTDAFVAKVKELTGGAGVAAVFDGVGKATFDASLAVVARKGSLISFGNASGAVEPFAISRLSAGNVRLMRPTLFNFIATRDEFERYTRELFEAVESGQVKVQVHEVYPLEEAARAQTDLESRKTTGKLVLRV